MRNSGLLCGLALFCDGSDLELQACLLLKAVDDREEGVRVYPRRADGTDVFVPRAQTQRLLYLK